MDPSHTIKLYYTKTTGIDRKRKSSLGTGKYYIHFNHNRASNVKTQGAAAKAEGAHHMKTQWMKHIFHIYYILCRVDMTVAMIQSAYQPVITTEFTQMEKS